MTRDDRFIGQLEDYLDAFDGDTPLPGHVRDAVRAELPGTRQVRPRRGPMRLLNVMTTSNSRAPWLVAAAAIVVAVVGGAWFLSGSRGDVGSVAPTVAPTTAPSAVPASPVPSAAAIPRLSGAAAAPCDEGGGLDCIEAGTYALDVPAGGNTVLVDVPEGWFPWYPSSGFQALLVNSGPDAPGGSGWGVAFMRVGNLSVDPCNADSRSLSGADIDTPDELAAAMARWPGFTVSAPQPTSLAGLDGVAVTVTSTRTTPVCAGAWILRTPDGGFVDAYPMVADGDTGRPAVFRILDAGDELLVVRTTEFTDVSPHEATQSLPPQPDRHTDDLVELGTILDSVRLEPAGP